MKKICSLNLVPLLPSFCLNERKLWFASKPYSFFKGTVCCGFVSCLPGAGNCPTSVLRWFSPLATHRVLSHWFFSPSTTFLKLLTISPTSPDSPACEKAMFYAEPSGCWALSETLQLGHILETRIRAWNENRYLYRLKDTK